MKGTSKVLVQNLLALHFDAVQGTFVDESGLTGGAPDPGNTISTVNAGYALVVLKHASAEFAGTPLEGMIQNALTAQADFLLDSLRQADGFASAYTLGVGPDPAAKTASAQAAAARGLYAAYEATGTADYLAGADEAYAHLIQSFYLPSAQAFRTTSGSAQAVYGPKNFALITGALREAYLVGGHAEAPAIYTRFFKTVGNQMQLSEGENTGESGSDSDGDGIPFIPEQPDHLPPVFATEATLDLQTVGVGSETAVVPEAIRLSQNYPNPFNPGTTIGFTISEPGTYALTVYDVTGRKVRTLVNRTLAPRSYEVRFDASHLATGVYFYELQGKGTHLIKKMILMK
ncbi:MAG: T9SS C-terminal target domain-containing protein [Candidatus Neomarinimicrobiota bacterium]|nr:MAG: T9SS C-terminal target domain-containing protein [Candidatus Neomarinimicrobiota bacterium]